MLKALFWYFNETSFVHGTNEYQAESKRKSF